MKSGMQRVNQLNRVSSKRKTKIFSLVFALAVLSMCSNIFYPAETAIASDITVQKTIELSNKSRTKAGEKPLTANSKLTRAAEAKAADMIANNYFSHTSPAGKTPWVWIQEENYDYSYAGENLAMDFHSAEKMEDAWMASPTHRANILNKKYKETGVAVKTGFLNGRQTIVVVVMFGSGDQNLSGAPEERKNIFESAGKKEADKYFPALPVGADMKNNISAFRFPIITSPKPGEIFSGSTVEIAGRAKPGEAVTVMDNGNFVGTASADSIGWFFLSEKNLSEGSHSIVLQSNNIIAKYATDFFVDRGKPAIDFRLYADKNDPSKLFLEASADKNNCTFQFNGESRYATRERKTLFPVDAGKSSAILRVSDQAGNKNFKQVNFANYYFGSSENKNKISDKLAALISAPENIFANDSGREAIKSNLGIAIGGINKY